MDRICKIYKKIKDKEEVEFISNYKYGGFTINEWLDLIEKSPKNDPKLSHYFDMAHNGIVVSMIHFILKKYVDAKKEQAEEVSVA